MIKKIIHDGDIYNPNFFSGFNLDVINDVAKIKKIDINSGNEIDGYEYHVSFVGFLLDARDDVLLSLPKQYKHSPGNEELECRQILKALVKYSELHYGTLSNYINSKDLSCNFPFDSFFGIYEYYKKYGLYHDQKIEISAKQHGKIDWKSTIHLTKKYVIDDDVVIFPIFRKKSVNIETFLTICMAFAINYTITKFYFFFDYPLVDVDFDLSSYDLLGNKQVVLSELEKIKKNTFSDVKTSLINNLICFFQRLSGKKSYFLKCYNFSAIWETAIRLYVCNHFDGEDSGKLKISDQKKVPKEFIKPTFYPNSAKPNEFMQPDCYFIDAKNQYILDAKYYLHIDGIMYKELSYVFLLKEIRDYINDSPKYKTTICALLLPSDSRKTALSFEMNPLFNLEFQDLKIYEEYFDIRIVLEEFVS